MKEIQILIVDKINFPHETKKKAILDVFARAIDHGLLAEVCEAFLESDAPDDVSCMLEAAREWDI